MKLDSRLKRLEAHAQQQREKDLTGVIMYEVDSGWCSEGFYWKPGTPVPHGVEVIDDIPQPKGFRGTLIIDNIQRTED